MSLKEYNKVTIKAKSGPDITLEVNFKEGAEKMVRVNENSIISMKDLVGFLMVTGDEETQMDLMPMKTTEVVHFEKIHRARATRDIKKGEEIRIHCVVPIESTVVEGLAGMVDKKITVTKPGAIPIIGQK